MFQDVKVLEAALTIPELLEILLERNAKDTITMDNLLSVFFGKSVKTTIDWQSLYYVFQENLPKKDGYDDILTYYENVS